MGCDVGTRHAEVPISRDLFAQRWEEMVERQGLPLSTPNEVAIHEVARAMRADGKVVTPLFRGTADTRLVNRRTGEIRTPRYEADASLHFEGTGETAWGLKFVLVAVRTTDVHGRIILDTDWVPSPGGEAATAMDSITRIAADTPGLQGVIYDGALRGVHHQRLLRDLGLLPINKVTAAQGTGPNRKKTNKERVEKSTFVEQRTITLPDGTERTIDLFARAGAIGILTLTDTGEKLFTELPRIRTSRKADKVGTYRWYNHHRLPDHLGGGVIVVRLHGNDEDRVRKFNRTENVRPIPPSDPAFRALYARRNDAESINRAFDDTLWLRRAHTVGTDRQRLNLLTYALAVNALALHRHRRTSSDPPLPLAARTPAHPARPGLRRAPNPPIAGSSHLEHPDRAPSGRQPPA